MKVLSDEEFFLYCECERKAKQLIAAKVFDFGLEENELADLIFKIESEKKDKNEKSDQLIDYNDEIVSIEEVGVKETIDISVSGDNLFYCNNILTKNSFGLPATADLMIALISTEELEQLGQVMIKQLKNRYSDPTVHKRFVVGVDRSKMRLYDVEQSAQNDILDSGQEEEYNFEEDKKFKKSFEGFKF